MINDNELKLCLCGCGEHIPVYDKKHHKFREYVSGHNLRIKKFGDQNSNWKEDNLIHIVALHQWVRRHLPKPEFCQICNRLPPYDLANVTGNYTRDFSNWQYLCRGCHMKSDGRINNLVRYEVGKFLVDMTDRICSICGSNKTVIIKPCGTHKTARPRWYHINDALVCCKCYFRNKRRIG